MLSQLISPSSVEYKTMPATSNSSSGKTRITIKYQNSEQAVSWYGSNTPSQTIEDAIRSVFQLSANTRILLKDQDGDVVAIAANLPFGGVFTLYTSSLGSSGSTASESNVGASSSGNNSDVRSSGQISPIGDVSDDHHSLLKQSISSPNSSSVALSSVSSSTSSSSPDIKVIDGDYDNPLKRDLDVDDDDEDDPRKKRKRRKAVEIDRSFKCSMSNCQKVYGSENALKMHMKLKHPEYQYLIQQTPNQKSSPIIVNNKLLNFNQQQQQQQTQQTQPSTQSVLQQLQFQQQQQQLQQQQLQQALNNQRISTSLLKVNQNNITNNNNGFEKIANTLKMTLPDMGPNEILLLSKQFSSQQQQQQQTQQSLPKLNQTQLNTLKSLTNQLNNNKGPIISSNTKELHQYSIQELLPIVRKSMEQIHSNQQNNNNNINKQNNTYNTILNYQQQQSHQLSTNNFHPYNNNRSHNEDDEDYENDEQEFDSSHIYHHINKLKETNHCNNSSEQHSNSSNNILPPISSINHIQEKGNLSFLVSSPSKSNNNNNNNIMNSNNNNNLTINSNDISANKNQESVASLLLGLQHC